MARVHAPTAPRDGARRVAETEPAEAAERAPRTDLGRRLRARRLRTGRSLADVAHEAEVDPGYLTYLEDRPTLPQLGTLARLARALDTTVPDLLGWAPPRAGGRHGSRTTPAEPAASGSPGRRSGDQRP